MINNTTNIEKSKLLQSIKTEQQCKDLAQLIMKFYQSRNSTTKFEVGKLQSDCYKAMSIPFSQTQDDINGYTNILSSNNEISITDIQKLCIKYFGGAEEKKQSSQKVIETEPKKEIKETHVYSKAAEARLQVARRIFKMLDKEEMGYITEKHVPILLVETYKNMGMTIDPTNEDVTMWMEMADLDGDGKVYLVDYEALVLKSLKSQGIQID